VGEREVMFCFITLRHSGQFAKRTDPESRYDLPIEIPGSR